MRHTHPAWDFWLRWMLATIGGAIAYVVVMVGFAVLINSAGPESVGEIPVWLGLILSTVFMGSFGAMIGLAQWLVLRRVLKGTGWWVPATMIGYAVLTAGGQIIPLQLPGWLIGGIVFLMTGVVLGLLQWPVLRRHITRAGWWIVFSIAGWALAYGLTGLAFVSSLYVEPLDMLAAFLVPAAVSGGGLAWLLHTPGNDGLRHANF